MTTALAAAILALAAPQQPVDVSLRINGVDRTAVVYPSRSERPKEGTPLVFGFHGHGGNMRQAARSFQIHEHWPEAVVVYMQGLPTAGRLTDSVGKRPGWQFGVNDQYGRDLKFFDAILKKVLEDHRIDKSRIYAMGHSNGGRFTYVLWASRPDVFAAFGPSGSPASGLLLRMKPKPVFAVAGEKDQLVSFESQKRTHDQLLKLNGSKGEGKKDGFVTAFSGTNGSDLSLFVHPGGHEYPDQATKLMVEFFKAHPKH